MEYQKRNFKKDQLLTAEDLNAMDNQIALNEESAKKANEDIKNKLDKSVVVQEKGNSKTAVMSQAAATEEFDKLSEENEAVKDTIIRYVETNQESSKFTDKIIQNTIFKLNNLYNYDGVSVGYASGFADKNHLRCNGTPATWATEIYIDEWFVMKPNTVYTVVVDDVKNGNNQQLSMVTRSWQAVKVGGINYEIPLWKNGIYKFTIDNTEEAECRFFIYQGGGINFNNLSFRVFLVEGDYNTSDIYTDFRYDAYNVPCLRLIGDMDGITKDDYVNMVWNYGVLSGYCSIKYQGTSSMAYPKKNYTIKFDDFFMAKEEWGAQKKYCLKANWIDFSHARNICSAKLWGAVVKSRTTPNDKLSALVNGGAIDGFPITLIINDEYQGIYTFNIPKDGWMFGMGNGQSEAIVCAEGYNDRHSTEFWAEAIDGDFEVEYVTDENNSAWVMESLNSLIRSCINGDSETMLQKIDMDSAIDYLIFSLLIQHFDGIAKNYLLATYDGSKWLFSAYDMDSTYGLWFDGSEYVDDWYPNYGAYISHKIFEYIWYNKTAQLKSRYSELRGGVLSEKNVGKCFRDFINKIPKAVYDEEVKIWNTIPSTSTNNLTQINDAYKQRCEFVDAMIEAL